MGYRWSVSKVGRPTDYKPEYCEQVERFCAVMGTLDEDVAQFFGVAVSTVYEWKKAHPEFSEAIKRGKAHTDRKVVEKLIDRAVGASYMQQKEVKLKTVTYDPKTFKKVSEDERVEVVTLEMTAPPDTQAIALFLHNRRSDLFKQKQSLELSADKDAPPVFTLKIDNS